MSETKRDWIPVRYVGGKPNGDWDHNYGSGVRWSGKGDVQLVPPAAAVSLLKHPEYEDARPKRDQEPIIPPPVKKTEEDKDEGLVFQLESLETKTKAEIVVLAKRHFGVDLDASTKKDELITAVRGLVNGRDGR